MRCRLAKTYEGSYMNAGVFLFKKGADDGELLGFMTLEWRDKRGRCALDFFFSLLAFLFFKGKGVSELTFCGGKREVPDPC